MDVEKQKIIELLRFIGFFIDEENGRFYLNDNSHKDDSDYAQKILSKYEIGTMINNQIVIENPNVDSMKELFRECKKGSVGTGENRVTQKWHIVQKRNCANKIPILWLEVYVARYIRSLSACGIYTCGCCDGNHPNSNKILIEFDGPIYKELHALFWEKIIRNKFEINWSKDYTIIVLEDKMESYKKLNQAAEYIYQHRELFRNLRMKSLTWLNKKMLREMTDEEIKRRFLEELEKNIKEVQNGN